MVAEIDEIIMKPTSFSAIYNCFLSQITDDMYLEMTPEDTIKDLQSLLVQVIPHFEFPRIPLMGNYVIETKIVNETEVTSEDFILEIIQDELPEDEIKEAPDVLIECSHFNVNLTPEEINILALLMKEAWVKRQLYSVEVTRMKYTGMDFKMTSQANHMSKLQSLLSEAQRESFHMQRLYGRRRLRSNGRYESNQVTLGHGVRYARKDK